MSRAIRRRSVSDVRAEHPQVAFATNMQRLLMRLKKSRLHDGQDTPIYPTNPFMNLAVNNISV
jgi:hypothetical protein